MKYLYIIIFLLVSGSCFAQEIDWIKTEGEITEIELHRGRKTKETAMVKFKLEDGTEVLGNVELFRIPFIGSMKSIGDKLSINYSKANPAIVQTVLGKFLYTYGMYILILLGIIFSIKPFLKMRKNYSSTS